MTSKGRADNSVPEAAPAEVYMTGREVAVMFRVAANTLVKWRRQGLKHIGVGKRIRYKPADIIAWLNGEGVTSV